MYERTYVCMYTMIRKKRATLFLIVIIPTFLGGFLHFWYQWKQK